MIDPGVLLVSAWIGFIWGRWWTERQNARSPKAESEINPGSRLIFEMLRGILAKRMLVGPEVQITRTQVLEIGGQTYKLILQTEHEWEKRPALAPSPGSLPREGPA